jgi:hypothetical protein
VTDNGSDPDDITPPELAPAWNVDVQNEANRPLVYVLNDLALQMNGLAREVAKLNAPASDALAGRIADGLGNAGIKIRKGIRGG